MIYITQYSKGNEMESAKEEAVRLIRRLPDDTTLEEIQYHLYVQQKVRRRMRDMEEGKVYIQEESEWSRPYQSRP
jgi:hypothetical protein